jgi:hypothetical protein
MVGLLRSEGGFGAKPVRATVVEPQLTPGNHVQRTHRRDAML